jgi:hypothetical protein
MWTSTQLALVNLANITLVWLKLKIKQKSNAGLENWGLSHFTERRLI